MNLSVVVLAKNEERRLVSTLKTLRFCSEIIVIDDYSEDKTAQIANENGAIVFKRALNGDFAAQRNFAMERTKGDWILFVDADEIVPNELRDEIQKVIAISDNKMNSYHIKRRDIFWGRDVIHGEVKTAYQQGFIRLVKKDSGRWQGRVHEVFFPTAKAGELNTHLIHTPHQTIKAFLLAINEYSDLRASELFSQNKRTNLLEIMLFPISKFVYTYFLKQGFLDGPAGFAYSFMMSFHSFLVRSKLYMKYQI